MTEQVTDSQVLTSLFAEENLDGYTIKPWTIKQLMQVTPILKALADELQGMGVSLDNIGDLVAGQGLSVLADLVNLILPQLPDFLAASLRRPREEMEELDMGLALRLAVRVLAMNLDHLKNAFNLVLGEAGTLTR